MTVTASLDGKTAIVTGASSGIGRAIAERLGASGALVYLVGRSVEPMEESLVRIEQAGGKGVVTSLDIRDTNALRSLIEQAAEDTGRLDVMVNNAGVGHPGKIAEGEVEKWREMLEVNVLSLLVGSQAAIKAMRRAGNGGHIVNVSSVAALRRDSGVYGATKHAVNAIGGTLRLELEDENIRVVTVMPGVIATNFARNLDPEVVKGIAGLAGVELGDWKPGEKIPDDVLEKVSADLETAVGTPDDVAEAVLYAVSVPLRLNIEEVVVRPAKAMQVG